MFDKIQFKLKLRFGKTVENVFSTLYFLICCGPSKLPVKRFTQLKKKLRKESEFPLQNKYIKIGDFTYGNPEITRWDGLTKLTVGKYCCIGSNVKILLGGEHLTKNISTYIFDAFIFPRNSSLKSTYTKGDVIIGNDVWFGNDVTILSGVTIGDGAVIGANSLVTKDIPDYSIVGGNPAKQIRMRFSDDVIRILKEIKWWDWPLQDICNVIPVLLSSDVKLLAEYYSSNIAPTLM